MGCGSLVLKVKGYDMKKSKIRTARERQKVNSRRIELIDKELCGTITKKESAELRKLQKIILAQSVLFRRPSTRLAQALLRN